MAQNLAAKYSPDVVEAFFQKSLTEPATNQRFDWDGVTTVNVYSVPTQALGNYTRGGGDFNHYGDPNDAGTTKQAMTLSRDRSTSVIIDKRNNAESQGVLEPNEWLAREIREQVIPEVDIYRLAALNTAADANGKDDVVADAASSSSNAWTNLMALNESLDNDLVPLEGRLAFANASYINYLKQSGAFVASEMTQRSRRTGEVGEVDGIRIIKVPASYMPTNTDLIVTHPSVMVSPMVLTDYHIHKDPPGVSGWQIDMRVVYDAFVLTTLVDAIAVHRVA